MKVFQALVFYLPMFAALSCQESNESPTPNPSVEDLCPDNPKKMKPGVCGCAEDDIIDALTGIHSCLKDYDFCPSDANKTRPGACGCGIVDKLDTNRHPICISQNLDLCPDDPNKNLPGLCGCGVKDEIDSETGLPKCFAKDIDLCPESEEKTLPGICGCERSDQIDPNTGVPTCISDQIDFCPRDPNKTLLGICGCGVPDIDSDGDGVMDCQDLCPEDPLKIKPLVCGCGTADSMNTLADKDDDTIPNCIDFCNDNKYKYLDDGCPCDALSMRVNNQLICAKIIATTEEFLAFRDQFNEGLFAKEEGGVKRVLLESINLNSQINESNAINWVAIGTESQPFNGIFIGKDNSITLTSKTGNPLTLGSSSSNYMGLFGYVKDAHIEGLKLDLNFLGDQYVAALAAYAENSHILQTTIAGKIQGRRDIGALVGKAIQSKISNVSSVAEVIGRERAIGGLIGSMQGGSLSYAASKATIKANSASHVAGLIGEAEEKSQIYNVYAQAQIQGAAYTAALIGSFQKQARLANAYSSSQVECFAIPCAGLVAHISEAVDIFNVYTTAKLLDRIDDGNAIRPGLSALISSKGSEDSSLNKLYYWLGSYASAIAPGLENFAQSFNYESLVPVDVDGRLLLTLLNENITCNASTGCLYQGLQLLPWRTSSFKINNANMTIPVLILSNLAE